MSSPSQHISSFSIVAPLLITFPFVSNSSTEWNHKAYSFGVCLLSVNIMSFHILEYKIVYTFSAVS
jgi:hypothetical protein